MGKKKVKFFPEKLYNRGYLTLYPTYMEECINFALSNKVEGIHIDSYFHNMTDDKKLSFFNELKEIKKLRIDLSNYQEDNLDFLYHLKKLETLWIGVNTKVIKNVEGLYSLKKLINLSLLTKGIKIDFSEINWIEQLSFNWDSNRIKGIPDLSNLEELSINSFNSKSDNFDELPNNENITKLKLYRGNQKSFLNFPKYSKIESLETNHYSKLEKVEGIEKLSNTLKYLQIENSRKITDHDKLKKLKELKRLNLYNCGEITDLYFIQKLKELKQLNFYKTNIKNGELMPILSHSNIEMIGFNNKKHYSHKLEQLKIELKEKVQQRTLRI